MVTYALTTTAAVAVTAAAVVYFVFGGNHCNMMIRFVFVEWIVP
jgi:hypothetical protein